MMLPAITASFLISLLVVRLLCTRFASVALDRPNERSLHQSPVPRTGGIGVLAGAAIGLAPTPGDLWLPGLLAALLAAISFADDARGVPPAVRFGVHIAAAGVLVWYFLYPMSAWQMGLMILAAAWITNLYNFMDGSDGLAGGMAVVGFGAYAVASYVAIDIPLSMLCSCLAAAAAGFLVFNSYPARIFLGDVGSIPLGFLAAALGLVGWRDDAWPLWFPLLVFGPFVGDATVTLLKRLLGRERVWQPHRDHYYQRLVRMGFGHRRTALICYGAMVVCAAIALSARERPAAVQAVAFLVATVLLAILAVWIDIRWRRFSRGRAA